MNSFLPLILMFTMANKNGSSKLMEVINSLGSIGKAPQLSGISNLLKGIQAFSKLGALNGGENGGLANILSAFGGGGENSNTGGILSALGNGGGLGNILSLLGGKDGGGLLNILSALGGKDGAGLGNILSALGGKDGAGLGNILSALGGKDGAGLGNILSALGGKDGAGLGNILSALGGSDGSGLASMVSALSSNPDILKAFSSLAGSGTGENTDAPADNYPEAHVVERNPYPISTRYVDNMEHLVHRVRSSMKRF